MTLLKNTAVLVLKVLLLSPLLLFAAWLIAHVYLPEVVGPRSAVEPRFDAEPREEPVFFDDEEGLFGPLMRAHQPRPPHHFHMTDPTIELHVEHREGDLTLCVECHGVYAHYLEEKSRGLLNLHGSFMDCAVCHLHARKDDGTLSLAWVDDETAEITDTVVGGFGKYPAKIYPVEEGRGGSRQVIHPVSESAAARYLRLRVELTPEQNTRERDQLHERLADEPISCPECHAKDGTFDFAALGFSRERAADLTSSEVARMIEEYEVFYLPSFLEGP
jgi:hypothetical protein